MELKNLRSFVITAETASFSVAASRCCLTQSAVSQHIKALEEELHCKLLIRNSHSITLTESEAIRIVDSFVNQDGSRGAKWRDPEDYVWDLPCFI